MIFEYSTSPKIMISNPLQLISLPVQEDLPESAARVLTFEFNFKGFFLQSVQTKAL